VGLPGEVRVAAMSVLKHGVVPRMALTLTPNSVKWFAGRVVMTLPCWSKLGHGPPSSAGPGLLKPQMVSAILQPSPRAAVTKSKLVPFH
jgi:hypothetical protein